MQKSGSVSRWLSSGSVERLEPDYYISYYISYYNTTKTNFLHRRSGRLFVT